MKINADEMRAHENKAAEKQRAHDKEAAAEQRAHELNLVYAAAKANAPKTVEQQLLELKGLLEKGLVTQEHHDKLKMKCLKHSLLAQHLQCLSCLLGMSKLNHRCLLQYDR